MRKESTIILQEFFLFLEGLVIGHLYCFYPFYMQRFAEDFLEEKLTPFYKSEPVPESVSLYNYMMGSFSTYCTIMRFCVPIQNEGDVKIVVGKNLDQIVLDESKDALLEVCSSWKVNYEKNGIYMWSIIVVAVVADICTMVWALSGTGAYLQQARKASPWH